MLTKGHHQQLTPQNNLQARFPVRVPIDTTWTADEGDLLEAVATVRVTAGSNTAYSHAQSGYMIVAP